MHPEGLRAMTELVERVPLVRAQVLDVGSYDINGTYRALIEGRGWEYTGLDLENGPNVDIISPDPYAFPLPDAKYDVVMSGSTMEHVQAIWRWIPELVRVLRPGGWLLIVTHWSFPEHKYPVDCWRIMPDGMRYLFEQTGVLYDYSIRIASQYDLAAMARKR